jgi:four helix bundle protein
MEKKTAGCESGLELKKRTKDFALRVIRLVTSLPRSLVSDVIGKQLLRAGTAVGANYRAACRARSAAEFRAKLGIVEEEADESAYWIELLTEAGIVRPEMLEGLHGEANELVAIMIASIKTTRDSC